MKNAFILFSLAICPLFSAQAEVDSLVLCGVEESAIQVRISQSESGALIATVNSDQDLNPSHFEITKVQDESPRASTPRIYENVAGQSNFRLSLAINDYIGNDPVNALGDLTATIMVAGGGRARTLEFSNKDMNCKVSPAHTRGGF